MDGYNVNIPILIRLQAMGLMILVFGLVAGSFHGSVEAITMIKEAIGSP